MIDKPKVYLAGAIMAGVGMCKEWRQTARERLEVAGIECLDPYEGKDASKCYDPAWIVENDLEMIHRADALLVEMSAPQHKYIGTSMEIRTAFMSYIPIFVWGDANKSHYWIQYHQTERFETLNKALDHVIDYLRSRQS